MKVKFELPIKLGQYQAIQKILDANKGAEESSFVSQKIVSIITGANMDFLRSLKQKDFDTIFEAVSVALAEHPEHKRIIEVDGVKYGFIPQLDDMTLGEYVDLEEYMNDAKDYHKAMAVMYRPITLHRGNTYLIEPYKPGANDEIMKRASLPDVLGALLFFWNLSGALLQYTQNSLEKELKTTITGSGLPLVNDGDGISPSTTSQVETLLNMMPSLHHHFTNALQSLRLTKSAETLNEENLNAK